MRGNILKKIYLSVMLLALIVSSFVFPSCREYDGKFDIVYFFKTEPEKAVVDFLESLNNKDSEYIYSNLMLTGDKNSISREKYREELSEILKDVESVVLKKTVYLGYESKMSKVVAEFDVTYYNGETKEYKKYFYLLEENGKWKIILEKTFI
jgi:hypothetical protein